MRHRDTPVDSFYGPLRDFNGDGFDDVVAGTRYDVSQLHVYLGAPRGLQETVSSILQSPDGSEFHTEFPGNLAIGDVNGDGRADLVTGEPYFGDSDWSRSDAGTKSGFGHVHVFSGGAEGLAQARNTIVDLREELARPADSHMGEHVALVDFNGDGFDDLVVSRDTTDRNQAQAILFLGSSIGLVNSPASGLRSTAFNLTANVSMCGVGDVDGDGYGDVAVGVSHPGRGVVLLHGNSEARLDSRLEEITSDRALLYFGQHTASGDVNGDGVTDLFVGSVGQVNVVYGTREGMETAPTVAPPPLGVPESGGEFGASLGVQGDLNGDGYIDLVAAGRCDVTHRLLLDASFRFCSSGVTYLYSSSSAGVAPMWSRALTPTSEQEGGLLYPISPGDLNGDGIDDLAIGGEGYHIADMPGIVGAILVYLGGSWDWTSATFVARPTAPSLFLGTGLY